MPKGKAKAPTLSPDEPLGDQDQDRGAVARRQSVSFSPDVRSHPDPTPTPNAPAPTVPKPKSKPSLMFARLSNARKSTDTLVQLATRSKSCSNLPETTRKTSSTSAAGGGGGAPLLILALASTSFLDTTISESGERLYVIDTKGVRTTICREDPIQGVAHVGAVIWTHDGENARERPAGLKSLATIQMSHGRRYYAEEFLRRTKLTR